MALFADQHFLCREPLCQFLGKPIPDVSFPHSNGGADFHRLMGMYVNRRLRETGWNLLSYASMLGAVVVGCTMLAKRDCFEALVNLVVPGFSLFLGHEYWPKVSCFSRGVE